MPKKPDRRIQKTKIALHTAFYDLLKKKNYSDITVKELADEADITRKTFYLHYSTLDDLLREFLTLRYGRIRELTGEIDLMSENFSYLEFFTKLRQIFESNQNIAKKMMEDQNSRYIMQQIMEETESRAFENAQAHFNMKPEILHIYFRYYTRGISGSFLEWVANPDSVSLEEFSDAIKNITLQIREALLPYRKPEQQ